MARNQNQFFLTRKDLSVILKIIESEIHIKYTRFGMYEDVELFNPLFNLIKDKNLGIAESGDWVHCISYIVSKEDQIIRIEDVPQKNGGILYSVDQLINNETIVFKPGGFFPDKNLIAGSVGTAYDNNDSLELYKIFIKHIKANSKKIGTFYVGKEAKQLLDSGWRLTCNIKSPAVYDLKVTL